jgi:hypothetical protein
MHREEYLMKKGFGYKEVCDAVDMAKQVVEATGVGVI